MPVTEIDMNVQLAPERITVLAAGASRSGKTQFAATFPRPVFLADKTEGGFVTIQHMFDDDFYEPGRRPTVFGVESPMDMMEALGRVEEDIKRDPTKYGTVVVDSLTFYAEMKFSELETGPDARDTRKLYGDLASHLRYFMIRIHKLPLNVVWLALAKEGGEDHSLGGISIPGQTAYKAPARCDIWMYMEQKDVKKGRDKEKLFTSHFQSYGGFKAGHRFGNMLPPKVEDLNYRKLEELLDLPPWVERLEPKTTTKTKRKAAAK